jgi:DNA polymerase-3 subunit delta'
VIINDRAETMWQLAGHSRATTLLQQSLRNGQLSHAYLFVGPVHVGKFTLAMNLAQAVNCESENRPCQECPSCRRIATSKHPDFRVIDLLPEKAKSISIDQIRNMQTETHLPPYEGKYKVFVIDGAHLLSHEAANSILKILEEPPPNILIILLTTTESALLPTIASRCQRVELRPLPLGLVRDVLVKNHEITQDKADLLARLSGGCLGWAILALQDRSLLSDREQRLADIAHLHDATTHDRLAYAANLATMFGKGRDKVTDALSEWLQWWRDLLLVKCDNARWIMNIDQEPVLSKQAGTLTAAGISAFMREIRATTVQLEQNANPRLALEVLMLKMP